MLISPLEMRFQRLPGLQRPWAPIPTGVGWSVRENRTAFERRHP